MKHVGLIIGEYSTFHHKSVGIVGLNYLEVIEKSGAIPHIILAGSGRRDYFLETCDGFIFGGGNDIDPLLYHQTPHGAVDTSLENDTWMINFFHEIVAKGSPIFGICKGMQLINVALGGTLIQSLPDTNFHRNPEHRKDMVDTALFSKGSFLERAFRRSEIGINSIHHEAVDTLGAWLRIAARSAHDDTIEALEHEHLPIYGTQWHPEELTSHHHLIEQFIWGAL